MVQLANDCSPAGSVLRCAIYRGRERALVDPVAHKLELTARQTHRYSTQRHTAARAPVYVWHAELEVGDLKRSTARRDDRVASRSRRELVTRTRKHNAAARVAEKRRVRDLVPCSNRKRCMRA